MIIVIITVSEYVRKFISGKFSTRPFAKYIAPSMYIDGVMCAVIASLGVSYGFWLLSINPQYSEYVLQISRDEYLIFGQVISFLGLIGNLLTCFLKRCANMDDDGRISPSNESLMFKNNTLMQIWSRDVLDYFSGILLPMMFVFWYATTYLSATFTHDPFEVSLLKIISD